MEPTPADVAAVAASIPNPEPAAPPAAPAPAAPPVQAPAEPAPQPAPAPSDPFASMFDTTPPAEPVAPVVPNQAPAAPVEPAAAPVEQPTPQPQQPVEPAQPAAPVTPPTQEDPIQTYDEYMESILAGVPKPPEAPDPQKINPESEEDIRGFFDGLMSTAEARFEAKFERKNAIQTAERKQWDEAFTAYPTLRTNKKVRDMVHNIRMGYFQRGKAISPTRAAKELIDSLSTSYKQGVADNAVVTTIESVQPTGGSSTPVSTTLDKESVLTAVQDGGEDALAQILDNEIKNNRL